MKTPFKKLVIGLFLIGLGSALGGFKSACKQWDLIMDSCDGHFYLCQENYHTDEDYYDAISYYDYIRCN